MKYRFLDGKSIEASSDMELVNKMRNASFSESRDIEDFMEACSRRAKKLGYSIRATSINLFVEDLIKNNLIFVEIPGDASIFMWN